MRRIAVLLAVLLLSASAAQAGRPAAGTIPASHYWSGAYVGAEFGYIFARDSDFETNLVGTFPISYGYGSAGPVAGLRAGYNLQAGAYVLGVEADIESGGVFGTQSVPAYGVVYTSRTTSAVDGSLRLRAGWAVDRTMIYGTGGIAAGRVTTQYDCLGCVGLANGLGVIDAYRLGWTAGVGVEYALTGRLSANVEYRYTDLGSQSASFPSPIVAWYHDNKFASSALRLGISYHF